MHELERAWENPAGCCLIGQLVSPCVEGCKEQKHSFLSTTMFQFFKKILYIENATTYLLKLAASSTTWCPLPWQTARVLIKVIFCTGQYSPISERPNIVFLHLKLKALQSPLACHSLWICNSRSRQLYNAAAVLALTLQVVSP